LFIIDHRLRLYNHFFLLIIIKLIMMLRSIAKTILKSPLKAKAPLFTFSNFQKEKENSPFIVEGDISSQAIAANYGRNKNLMRVYNTTGLSILGALGTAFAASACPLIMANADASIITGFVMNLAGLISTIFVKPTTVIDKIEGVYLSEQKTCL
jgi:hypothetical protein